MHKASNSLCHNFVNVFVFEKSRVDVRAHRSDQVHGRNIAGTQKNWTLSCQQFYVRFGEKGE